MRVANTFMYSQHAIMRYADIMISLVETSNKFSKEKGMLAALLTS